jgi:hypothetical protein
MLDNLEKARTLIKKMERHLPIPAIPSKEMLATLNLSDSPLSLEKEGVVFINKVHYMGDEAGIVCEIGTDISTEKVILSSVTHLLIDPTHPLFHEIFAYQKKRISKLKKSSSHSSKPSTKLYKPQKKSPSEKPPPKKELFGHLPPRYSFFLNPYEDLRFSRCPTCEIPTKLKKFVFVIRIEPNILFNSGLTCRFCAKCELIILHQNELEKHLAGACITMQLDRIIGNPYFVLGTLKDKKKWREKVGQGIRSNTEEEVSENTIAFKQRLNFKVTGGWMRSPEKK